MPSRTRHMHTVPRGYLAGFADPSAPYEKPHVWRFERQADEPKLVGVRKTSAQTDVYTLWTETGKPDMSIETELLDKTVENGFSGLVALVESGRAPSYWGWRQLSRYMAFQLLRTPRALQIHRDAGAMAAVEIGRNDPQLAMAYMAPKIENWLCQMSWHVFSNPTDFPFLSSDNPVTTWADRGPGAEGGVGFSDPALRVLFPLRPRTCLAIIQTTEALKSITADTPEKEGSFTRGYELSIRAADLSLLGVVRHNQVTVSNADKYCYASCNDERLHRFMLDQFIHRPAPVRRFDRRPIGSPPGLNQRHRP
jgi:hypothetical protein